MNEEIILPDKIIKRLETLKESDGVPITHEGNEYLIVHKSLMEKAILAMKLNGKMRLG